LGEISSCSGMLQELVFWCPGGPGHSRNSRRTEPDLTHKSGVPFSVCEKNSRWQVNPNMAETHNNNRSIVYFGY
jgi:hypothetical protein